MKCKAESFNMVVMLTRMPIGASIRKPSLKTRPWEEKKSGIQSRSERSIETKLLGQELQDLQDQRVQHLRWAQIMVEQALHHGQLILCSRLLYKTRNLIATTILTIRWKNIWLISILVPKEIQIWWKCFRRLQARNDEKMNYWWLYKSLQKI